MSRRFVSIAAITAFLVGAAVAPAVAGSHATYWFSIFGNNNSCGMARASINDDTHKSGAITANRKGCSGTAAAVSVPSLYLSAGTQIYREIGGYYCSNAAIKTNTSTATEVVVTSALVPSSGCPSTGTYRGLSSHIRKKAAGGQVQIELVTSQYAFN